MSEKENVENVSSFDRQQRNDLEMTDENRDPTSKCLTTKNRPKPIDVRSASVGKFSSSESPKSATITNVSQRLPSTSVEVSVGDILSNDEKRASVSIRHQQRRQSSSSNSSTENNENIQTNNHKMDLGEATRELTRLLHIGNEISTKEVHLNPDAPDFTPLDFSPTYRSELAPAHLHRRATQVDYYNNRYSRSRYYSESYNAGSNGTTNTSTIRPLLSLVPQFNLGHRQSWTNSANSSNGSWWQQQDQNNTPSSSSSYHSRPAYPLYSPLMGPLTDDGVYHNRHSSKRVRAHSNRTFVFPTNINNNRKRSHSGPETPIPPPENHLSGVHSLARIMVDILRMIDHPNSYSISQQRKHCRTENDQQESIETEDVFVDESSVKAQQSIEVL